jgi:TetR/AcrR family transcriptional repressor of bet genes
VSRASNTAERRRQIVDGLLDVMAREGYDGASIQAIGKAAGLAPGLVHYHFETKQDVLIGLVEALSERLEERYRTRAADARDAEGHLDALIDAHVALGRDADPRAVAVWNAISAEAVRQPKVRALYRAALARSFSEMRKLVRLCLLAEKRSTRHAGRIAAGLLSTIEGAYRIAAAAPRGLPRGYAAPVVRRMARSLILAEPRST